MPKRQRQPKAQPTPEQVAETVRTNAQELYKHYRELLARSDSKDLAAHTEAVVANEALGVLAYSIPPCAVEAFDSPMVCAYQAMHVLTLLNKTAMTEVENASETLVQLGSVVPVTSTVWTDLMNVIARIYAVLNEQPVTLFNDLILNQRLLELKACVRDAEQKITDLTPSREVENGTDTPSTHA